MTTDCSCSVQKKQYSLPAYIRCVFIWRCVWKCTHWEERHAIKKKQQWDKLRGIGSCWPVSTGSTLTRRCCKIFLVEKRLSRLMCHSRHVQPLLLTGSATKWCHAGHRPKVGHKSFAHAHNLLKKTLHVCESCADCLLEKASEKTKRYLRKKNSLTLQCLTANTDPYEEKK